MKANDYINHRKKLANLMTEGFMSIVNSNDVMPTNADGTMKFRQNNDLYWLTGIKQQDTTLLLFPGCPDKNLREVLFIKHADETFFKWHGRSHSLQEASELSGIANVRWAGEFEQVLHSVAVYAEGIYLNAIEHPRAANKVQTRDDRFSAWCREKYQHQRYKRLAPLMARLRIEKSERELEQLQEACRITELGFRRLLQFVKPGVREKQVVAELIHEYLQHGGDWAGYEPIVASGQNSCILHYIENSNACLNGDVLLVDAAASFNLYNADLTRVIPVSGVFNARQKEVYSSVLKIHKALKTFACAGKFMHEIEAFKNELVLEELIALKLCTAKDIIEKGQVYFLNRYSYHGFGHFLGLDVHDVGDNYQQLPVNSVITIEPGIYIWEEEIGVRLENNVVLTPGGTNDLMARIPIEPEEIEELMTSR